MARQKTKVTDSEPRARIHPLQAPAFQSEALAREFLRSPKKFAKKLGIPLESLACPPEAHAALERGEAFAREAEACGIKLDDESIRELHRIASLRFGRDYEVAFIPFGLQFRERMKIDPNLDWTASGTVTITWADSDSDVDG